MKKTIWTSLTFALALAYAQSPEMQVVNGAAEALGGKARIQSVKTLTVEGEGTNPNIGQNPTPDAPLEIWKVTEFKRTIDLANGRMRLQQHRVAQFAFALATDVHQDMSVDGEVAWNTGAGGKATRVGASVAEQRRLDMLGNPVFIVRAALNPAAKLGNLRKKDNLELVDITTPKGVKLTLAVDGATHLPAYVEWISSSDNLGDVLNRTAFLNYETVGGIKLPKRYLSTMDFRDWTTADIQVSKNTLDGDIGDLAAPAAVKSTPAPVPPPDIVTAEPQGKGIWWMAGTGNHRSVLFEFDDHMTLFEAPDSAERAKDVIDKARTVVPNKPLTEVIVSHHHFDHSTGLRVVVAEGLTVITQKANEQMFREIVARKATLHPDELAMNPKPLKIKTMDDTLVLKDKSMEVDLYRVKGNIHAGLLIMAWVPRDRILVQGDLYDVGWLQHPWAVNYAENLKMRNLDVAKDLPIHGRVQTRAEEIAQIESVKKAKAN
jgi:glyoxylase-like metal-dependent hydrolase (beta-lactamase superfamily II)